MKEVSVLYSMSDDERTKEAVRMRQKALNDKISELAAARREGRADIIRKMRAIGISESQILNQS